jgi:hypothetical protein
MPRAFSLLWEERAQGDVIQSSRLWQPVGLLIGAQGRFGLRPKLAVCAAGVKPQGFQLALRLLQILLI